MSEGAGTELEESALWRLAHLLASQHPIDPVALEVRCRTCPQPSRRARESAEEGSFFFLV